MRDHDEVAKFETVDEYLGSLPPATATALEQVRQLIRAAAPAGTETISYQIAAVKLNGKMLVYYAGWKDHVSLYPVPDPAGLDPELAAQIDRRRAGRGTLHFPLSEPIPADLITAVVTRLIEQRTR